MSFERGFKIPGSFLKRKTDQSHSENIGTNPPEAVALVKRQGISSSRLFGNLTRGGPTSVQSVPKTESSSSILPGGRSSLLKPKNRRWDGLAQKDSFGHLSHKSSVSGVGTNESVSRFKLVRNVGENVKERSSVGSLVRGAGDEPVHSSSFLPRRSPSSLASAAAIKRATKLVRAKGSSSREEGAEFRKHTANSNLQIGSGISQELMDPPFMFPSKFRATSFAAESKTTTRDEAVLLRSLLALVGRHCPTDYDRYLVLEERDKLLSKLRDEEDKKNGGRTRVLTGHCTAMCPEKERYVRVVQKRISQFECGADGPMKPHLMVKEYARSAADQDKPLPHELRSKALLENTVDYLLKNVLDAMPKNDDDMSMWYDFLWSRTRAIRKEITQLMLSDRTSVALFERCARLHILCAYKLCHLDFDKFDQNMNTENLAKCLQSLRHLYEDLRVQGTMFDTEAEFRGYDVMLHLHDSNILRQVLSYRKEVRESRPVRLALQLSSALQNKNYVRFFRLLRKEATFLQCCICHRYFNTVQSKALLTMMAAYGRNPVFNLDTILRVLAWNDRNDALVSLAQYGVHQNDMDCDQVILNRDLFIQDASVPLRPYRWIDEKNTVCLSQVAYGPIPFSFSSKSSEINSFDDDCHYTKDPVLAAVFRRYSFQSEAQQQHLTLDYPSGKLTFPSYEDHCEIQSWISYIVQNTLYEVADEQSYLISRVVLNMEEVSNSLSDHLLEDIIRETLLDTLSNERDLKRKQALQKFSRLREEKQMLAELIVDEVISEVLHSDLKTVVKNEFQKAIHDYIDATAHFIVENIWRLKFIHIVDKETKAVLKKTFKTDFSEVSVGLRRFRERMELLWLRQFWDAWRFRVLENRRKRLERHRNWERFQGNWNCQMFVPLNYVINTRGEGNGERNSLLAPILKIDEIEVRRKLRLAQLKTCRRKIIMRVFFDKWRSYAQRRRQLRNVAMVMLHRPRLSNSMPRPPLQFQPSFAASKRKRMRSPSLGCLPGSFLLECSSFSSSPSSWNADSKKALESSQLPSEFKQNVTVCSVPRPFVHYSILAVFQVAAEAWSENLIFICSDSIDIAQPPADNSVSTSLRDDRWTFSEGESLFFEASSLHERMLTFSKDLNSLIKRRKNTDDECSRTAFQLQSLSDSISKEL